MTQPTGPDDVPTGTAGREALAGTDVGGCVIDLADRDWCWSRFRSGTRGALSSRAARRPVSLHVDYLIDRDRVVIPLAVGSRAIGLLAGLEVTLGLTGHTDDGSRWVVRLTGRAQLTFVPNGPGVETCRSSYPATGGVPAGVDALVLPAYRLRGYHESRLDSAPDGGPVSTR